MKQFWLEIKEIWSELLEWIRNFGLIRMFKCCFIALFQGIWAFVKIIFGCLVFTTMTCVIYQNGWISWFGHGEISTEIFQALFWFFFDFVLCFCISKKIIILMREVLW